MDRECYYILAGETSADMLAAHLMRAVQHTVKQPISWMGIGGEQMQKVGLHSSIPISKLSVIGVLDAIFSYNALLQIAKDQVKQKMILEIMKKDFYQK